MNEKIETRRKADRSLGCLLSLSRSSSSSCELRLISNLSPGHPWLSRQQQQQQRFQVPLGATRDEPVLFEAQPRPSDLPRLELSDASSPCHFCSVEGFPFPHSSANAQQSLKVSFFRSQAFLDPFSSSYKDWEQELMVREVT